MKKHTEKLSVTRATYIKTLLFFSFFAILMYLGMTGMSHQDSEKQQENQKESTINEEQVQQHVKTALYNTPLQIAKHVIAQLNDIPITEQNLKKAVSGNRTASVVAVWPKNARWPVRFVDPGLWEKQYISSLEDAEKQEFYDFLFEKQYSVKPSGTVYTGRTWKHESHVMISIGYVAKTDRIDAVEVKFEPYFKTMMANFFKEKTRVYVVDAADNVMYAQGGAFSPQLFSDPEYRTVNVPEISLRILYHRQTQSNIVKPGFYRRIFGFLLLILVPVLSLLLAVSIDRPLIKLSREVTEIGKGNFSQVVPPYKNRHIDQIGRVCNYMSQEMDSVRNVDMESVLKEKHNTDAIIDYIPDGVMVTDMQDRILRINKIAEHWFSSNKLSSDGRNVDEYIGSGRVKNNLQKVREGAGQSSCDFYYNKRWFSAHSDRIVDETGRFVSVVTVFRDITKIKEAEDIKGDLVSMVSHELKSPLSAIYGFSELMSDLDLNNKQAEEYTRIISGEATRLTDLVNKFLDISSIQMGRTPFNQSVFSINTVVVKTIDTLKTVMDKKNIRVVINIDSTVPDVRGDIDMIELVLINLLDNAIKYSPEKSKIGIEAKKDGDQLRVSVIDNGYGIPEESMDKIFNQFYKVTGSSDSEASEGSGLGLALCKEIISRHKGEIKVKSKLGVGSVFSFSMPVADVQEQE